MADEYDDEPKHARKLHANQPYDESLDIPDAEDVASQYTPTPRVDIRGGKERGGGGARGGGAAPRPRTMSDASDDGYEDKSESLQIPQQAQNKQVAKPEDRAQRPTGAPTGPSVKPLKPFGGNDDDDDDDGESGDDDDDDDDDESPTVEGAYNPADYEHLAVTPEIKELFQYITRYTPQNIDLEHRLKPFIPDFIPAVGDIDAFIKVPRHDGKTDSIGLVVLDEPCAKQSDPVVLDLTLRAMTKQTNLKEVTIKRIDAADKNSKAIDSWIKSISELHRTKPPPNVHYSKNMPDIDTLMEEWPPEFEELLKEITLPSAEMECDLKDFVDISCGLVDIPVHKSRIQSLHLLFTLYSEFKNSQHFQALASENKLDGQSPNQRYRGAGEDGADRLTF